MHIKETILNFLYDKNYFISVYDDYVHVYNYKELISLTSKLIIFKMDDFNLEIKGDNLFITKMMASEVLIKGKLWKIGFNYE